MRRKAQAVKPDQVVPMEILRHAKALIGEPKKIEKCMVCGAETSSGMPEPLCWVCRRLKVSAWRDIEQQIPAQE